MWGPGPRSRSRLDPTQPGRANLRPASAVGTPNSLRISATRTQGIPDGRRPMTLRCDLDRVRFTVLADTRQFDGRLSVRSSAANAGHLFRQHVLPDAVDAPLATEVRSSLEGENLALPNDLPVSPHG